MPALSDHLDWFTKFKFWPFYHQLQQKPVAYFCAEYAFSPHLPIYAGGLGVLAADYIREANDRNLPVVGIGLWYGSTVPSDLEPVVDAQGNRVIIKVPIIDQEVSVQAWKLQIGLIPVFLLDTRISENSPSVQAITQKLYVADKETRLKQEIILGIGGCRMLEALDIHPHMYHMNEGHSGFMGMELIHHEMQKRKLGFHEAIPFARRRLIFTNHTLLPAGQEVYSNDLVSLALAMYAEQVGVPVDELVKLGLVQESNTFSMTLLGLRLAGVSNAVSLLHSRKAEELWTDHPMAAVTNGIHLPTWDTLPSDAADPDRLFSLHQNTKHQLLNYVFDHTGIRWETSALLAGWARRFVDYKRPLEIFSDLSRLSSLARSSTMPFKVVISGQSKETGHEGQEIEKHLQEVISQISDYAVYLPGYDLQLAKLLTSGCDLWLNTPIVGFEACGTSGMKAALNGVLPVSTKDGWFDEIDPVGIGWQLENDQCASSFYDLLEKSIAPLYYQQPNLWAVNMANARKLIQDRFSTTRMLREYLEKLYQ